MQLYWGIDQDFTETVGAQGLTLGGKTLRFDLGKDYRQLPLLTVLDDQITANVVDGNLTFTVPIDGGALATQLEQEKTHSLNWQLRVQTGTAINRVFQGSVKVLAAYGDVVAEPPQSNFYLTTESTLNDFADVDAPSPVSGQVLAFDGVNWAPTNGLPGLALATVADSAPSTGQNGQLWFNFSTNVLRVWYDDEWVNQTLDDGQY
ncbi:MAG: hypothetical protein AAGF24_04810 [Cyanobacteria bacterium P01_H01_bin.121]